MTLRLHIEHLVIDAAFAGESAQIEADLAAALTQLLQAGGQTGGQAGAVWAGLHGQALQIDTLAGALPPSATGPLGQRIGHAVAAQLAGAAPKAP